MKAFFMMAQQFPPLSWRGPVLSWEPTCVICGHAVPLESANSDEYGNTVHEDCYVSEIASRWAAHGNDGAA
ncbi:MAG TPA: hypothetical protein VND65_09040 [Candidatus Binatia bacterium]|nr:hypothetical protein [Candidatus Binatia bacterium]